MRITNQAVGIAFANHHKTETAELRLSRPRIMCGPDTGEEMLREREIGHTLDLVDEDDNPLLNMLQDNLHVKLNQALPITKYRVILPPGLQICLQSQLA